MTVTQHQSFKTPQEEIIYLEKSFAAAIKTQEISLAEKFLSATYFLSIGVEGMPFQIIPRSNWLSGLKDYETESFSIDDIKVNVYGNTAIAMLMYSQIAKVRGDNRNAQFVLIDIWVKQEAGWFITERHSSRPEIPIITRPL